MSNIFNNIDIGDVVTLPSDPNVKMTVNRTYLISNNAEEEEDAEDELPHFLDLIYKDDTGAFHTLTRVNPNAVIKVASN